jgi:hypothetical protein
MGKRQIRQNTNGKKMGRSMGPAVKDPVVGDTVSAKIFKARKQNNPKKYENLEQK